MCAKAVIRGDIESIAIVPYDPTTPTVAGITEVIVRGRARLRRREAKFTYALHLMYGGAAYERALSLGEAESWVSVEEYRRLSGYLRDWIEHYFGTYDWPTSEWLEIRGFTPYLEKRGAYVSARPEEFVVAEGAQ